MPGKRPPSRDEITKALAASLGKSAALPAPIDEELWERRMKALTLRNGGHTFAMIAADLGIHPDTARTDVRIARSEVMAETIDEGVSRQVSVLRDMQHGAYPAAMAGDKDAIMAVVRCLEQEAKLRGFYAPTRQIASINDVDFAQQVAELIGKLGLSPSRELMASLGGGNHPDITAEVSEIIDGVLERIMVDGEPIGFDVVAAPLPIEDEGFDLSLQRAISQEAVSEAAAEAITGGESAGNDARWSNL